MIVMRFMMKTAAMTTMIAGPRTVVWGCFSPVQRLDERSKAMVITLPMNDLKQIIRTHSPPKQKQHNINLAGTPSYEPRGALVVNTNDFGAVVEISV
jgi:hypothetical protein